MIKSERTETTVIMADAASRKRLKEIRSQNGNNICVECDKLNPQWISVTYAIWMCIECSGKHRSLGLHLSQVKSITMDKWSPKEIERVEMGGNRAMREFIDSHESTFDETWSLEEKYQSQLLALYRDKVTMEAAGEIWIEEESPIYSQMKDTTSVTAVEVKTEEDTSIIPARIVEVEVEQPPSTFGRLGQGLALAGDYVRETTKQAADELTEFKDANATLTSTKQNVTCALSSWGGWASSLAKNVTEKLDDQLAQMVETQNGDGACVGSDKNDEIGGSFWSSFGNKKPPAMCMSVSTISEPEDN